MLESTKRRLYLFSSSGELNDVEEQTRKFKNILYYMLSQAQKNQRMRNTLPNVMFLPLFLPF